jgi:hypothetical protein
VSREKMEFKDRRVYPVFKESKDHKEQWVFRVYRVFRDSQDLRERLE